MRSPEFGKPERLASQLPAGSASFAERCWNMRSARVLAATPTRPATRPAARPFASDRSRLAVDVWASLIAAQAKVSVFFRCAGSARRAFGPIVDDNAKVVQGL